VSAHRVCAALLGCISGSRPSVTVLLFVDDCLHGHSGSGVSPWLMARVKNQVPYHDT